MSPELATSSIYSQSYLQSACVGKATKNLVGS
jgi:hypothetical protein